MSKIQWKGAALLSPMPAALVTCGTMDSPNIITIAWTGIINSQPPKTYISLRESRHSYNIIKDSGEFVINLTTQNMAFMVDYCGVKSGKNTNKFADMKIDTVKSTVVSCPSLKQSPLSLECRVFDIVKLGSHDMFMADIVSVMVQESLIDDKGRLDLSISGLMAYAHGEYYALGKKLGKFGFSVRKKKKASFKK